MATTLPTGRPVGRIPEGQDEAAIYRERARRLGLSFFENADLGHRSGVNLAAIRRASFALSAEGERLAYLAPDEATMADTLHWLGRHPAARSRLRVTTRSALRAALVRAGAAELVEETTGRLERVHPSFSARRVATPGQIATGLFIAVATVVAFSTMPFLTLGVLDLLGAVFFFGITVLRFIAAGADPNAGRTAAAVANDDDVPVYTVLVALRDEAAMVSDLVAALAQLDWPRAKLDIKLIVEADDAPTIAAVNAVVRGPPFEVVVVPPMEPRTKPKALSFALALARGDFVTVYDAEDRPDPRQLRAAWAAFAAADDGLACVQAPLVIDNGDAGWLARLFTAEYAALFDGLLPTLVSLGLPIPLGGTSNHFRRAALLEVGGWDPFNVTEDADLGLRLARFGYRVATLSAPTFEEAPAELRPWLRQRTRWFKGWMQTWLVHLRQPRRLARELGPRGLLGFNLVCTGIIVSALVYPVYLFTVLILVNDPLNLWGNGTFFEATLLGVNAFNLVAGYVSMALLAGRALRARGRARMAAGLIWLPVYWLLMSLAAYRALVELFVRPWHWHKTPHRGRGAFSDRRAE